MEESSICKIKKYKKKLKYELIQNMFNRLYKKNQYLKKKSIFKKKSLLSLLHPYDRLGKT